MGGGKAALKFKIRVVGLKMDWFGGQHFIADKKCLGVSGLCISLTGFEAFSFSQIQLMLNYLLPSVGL